MISAQEEEVSTCDLHKVGVDRGATEGCLWSRHGGFQQSGITDAVGATERRDDTVVDCVHRHEIQMFAGIRGRDHASRLSVFA